MTKVLDTTFIEFKEYVLPLFAETFPVKNTHYVCLDAFNRFGDSMLQEYAYDSECEEFLIQKTKLFIRCQLDSSKSYNTSMQFLEKLTNKIAAYLSYYIMNKYQIPESPKSKNKLRIRVQAELKSVFFDENNYINSLKIKHEHNREMRKKTNSERKRFKHAAKRDERRQAATDAYNNAQQIRVMFFEAQNIPRRR